MAGQYYHYTTPLAPRVILATTATARRISLADPEAVVLDVAGQTIIRDGLMLHFSLRRWNLAYCILAAQGRAMHGSEITDFVWGDDEDGGPDDARRTLATMMTIVRNKLRRLGIGFETECWIGFRAVDLNESGSLIQREAA